MNLKQEKMKQLKKIRTYPVIILSIILTGIIFTSASLVQPQEKWVVPAAAKNMKNPTDPGDEEGLFIGKSLYAKNCKSCHGKSGLGDGPNSKELTTFAGDFSTAEFKAETDGEIFFKIMEGRKEMPSFKKVILDEEEAWFLVNYIRTMAD